jgi:uncharacterized protein YecT (DUF1311 family)
MKISKFILAAFIISAGAGCKKDYTCVCSDTNGTTDVFTVKTTKSKADKQCNEYYNAHYGSITFDQTKCELK